MRSNEILAAILATIAYLETAQTAPVQSLSSPVDGKLDLSLPIFDINQERSVVTTVAEDAAKEGESLLDKAIGAGVTGAASSAGSGIGTEVVDGVKSLASKIGLKREDQPAYHVRGVSDLFTMPQERSVVGTVAEDAAKEGESLLDKAIGAGVTGAASSAGSGIGTEVVDGVKSLASKIGLKREDQPAYHVRGVSDLFTTPEERSVSSSLLKAGESALTGAAGSIGSEIGTGIVDGAETLYSDVTSKRDGQPSQHVRSLGSLLGDAAKALAGGAAKTAGEDGLSAIASDIGLKRDDQPSHYVRGIGSLLGDAAKALAGGAAKTAGEDGLSAIASDIGLKRDDQPSHYVRSVGSLLGDAAKSLAGGAAKTVGEDALSGVWDDVKSAASGAGIDLRDVTETYDAPVAKRTGFWSDVESVGESVLPKVASWGLDALDAAEKRSTETVDAPLAARSGIVSEVEGVAGKVLPWALDAFEDLKRSETVDAPLAARSGIVSDIEGVAGKVLPWALDAFEDLKRSETVDAPLAARSGIVSDIEGVAENALPKVASWAASALEDLKRSETRDAPLAQRSSEVLHDIETVGGTALKVLGGLFEDE